MDKSKVCGGHALRIAVGIIMLVLLLVGGVGALPAEQWNKTFGGTTSYEDARSVQQTSDGGYILACEYLNPPGSSDFLLIKTDADGAMQWNKTFGGTSGDYPKSVQQTSEGGYILAGDTTSFGAGNSDAWLIKTDANGIMQWNKTFGGTSNDYTRSVQQTSDGGYIIAGLTASFGAGYFDAWLIKTDEVGTIQWSKTFGGINYEGAESIQQTSDGGYVLAGESNGPDVWLIKTDASGNMQWNKTFGGTGNDVAYSVKNTLDGGYILAGFTYSFGSGYSDAWLIKTNASGNEQWNRTFGGASMDMAYSVQQTLDGGYILTGDTSADAWLIKTDSIGNEQWNRTFGKEMNIDGANSVQQTSDGGYILAGHTDYTNPTGPDDAWLIKVIDDTTPPVISISSCTMISSPGEYVLDQNILNSGASSCINITSSNVIFDGAGYTIDGIDIANSYGLYVYNSAKVLTNVTVKNLKMMDWFNGIYYENTQNGSIVNNTATNNNFGINLSSSSNNNTLSDNIASNNNWAGIYLYYSNNNNTLRNNIASNNTYDGIGLYNSNNNNILSDNIASNNYRGIFISTSSNNNTLSDNIASNNTYDGIILHENSKNNTLSGNTATNNNINGICIDYYSTNNTLNGNIALNNTYGISLEYSSNNNTLSNNIASNNTYGIHLLDSSTNTIYNNYFNNTYNFELGSRNIWNLTKSSGTTIVGGPNLGGNFWAYPNGIGFSQTCPDTNKDGICDVPYILNANNTDYLPLTIPAGYSYIYGTVSNGSIGIAGATVATNTSINTSSDASGSYSLLVPAGTYKLTATSAPRFYTNSSITLTVVVRTTVMQDIEFLKKPTGNISGSVSVK